MRIAYVLTQDKGGPVDMVVRLAATIAAEGEHEVRVFAPRPARGADLIAGIHTEIEVPRGNIRALRQVRRQIRRWSPDIVHGHDRRSGLIAAALHKTNGGPKATVHTYHGVPDDVGEPWFRGVPGAQGPSKATIARLTAEALVERSVTRTVVPATAMRDFLIRRLRLRPDRVVHIDNGVELPQPATPPLHPVRSLLFVGLLIPRKALMDLLVALSAPGVMPADATLAVAGDGETRAACEAFAQGSPIADRVSFLGFRSDVPDLLAKADALVLTSHMEQQPMVIAEAMASGKPVLATDTGGVAEMIDIGSGQNFLADPGDVASISAALTRLFAEPNPERIGRALAERAWERFSAEACARAHLKLYAELSV